MTQLISRVYHYLTDDINTGLEVSDCHIWLANHPKTED